MAVAKNLIGVLGGTFDPFHNGHLQTALGLLRQFDFNQIRLIPCADPPHRACPDAAVTHRLAMLTLAAATIPELVVDKRELERPGPSYTVDTLQSLRGDYPNEPLCLIVGMDSFLTFPAWNRWQKLFDLGHIVVVARPGSELVLPHKLEQEISTRVVTNQRVLESATVGYVLFWQGLLMDVSASHIRQLLASGKSIRHLVPDVVHEYIQEHGLYKLGQKVN